MIKIFKLIKISLEFIRCLPHIILFYLHPNKAIIHSDIQRWLKVMKKNYSALVGFIYLMSFHHAYRNLFYHRIGFYKYFLNIICPGISTLIIETKEIGEGLYISHGFSTAIGAKSIGKNCWINQQVTIGNFGDRNYPVILDNVIIRSGAVIIGNITIGNNVIVGANATVFKDIPDNCTVFPARPMIMKWSKNNPTKSHKVGN